jgi:GMP synthase (glutamine-hydrolysing)
MSSRVLILDFGSQYTQLIARRVRELKVFCEILPCNAPLSQIVKSDPDGIILSGGPSSVYDKDAPPADRGILDLKKPILGICYGMQWLCHQLGGKVEPGEVREYGAGKIKILRHDAIFSRLPDQYQPQSGVEGEALTAQRSSPLVGLPMEGATRAPIK